jgi:murein L,D-transpeptidase YcbB/YkuD
MNQRHSLRITPNHHLIPALIFFLMAVGASGLILVPQHTVWAADDCAQRCWEQLSQDAWKHWPKLADRTPATLAHPGTAANVAAQQGSAISGLTPAAGSPLNAPSGSNATSSPPPAAAPVSPWESPAREALLQILLTDSDRETIIEAYQNHRWEPLFVGPGFQLTADGSQLLARLEDVEADAIDPQPYQLAQLRNDVKTLDQLRSGSAGTIKTSLEELIKKLRSKAPESGSVAGCEPPDARRLLESALASSDPSIQKSAKEFQTALRTWYGKLASQATAVDVQLSSGLLRFARDMQRFSKDRLLLGMNGKGSMNELLKSLEPTSPHYQALRRGYLTYRNLARRSQQKVVNAATSIRPGTRGPVVRTLQERLHEEGFYSGEFNGVYDPATVEAVKRFQTQHLQDGDGVLGKKTVEWLNVSFEKKSRMIAQSLEAIRKSETRNYDRVVRINIPQFVLEYVKNGRVEATHRVIVGKSSGKRVKMQGRLIGENQTPTLVSNIQQLVFNPRWYVSDRISLELDVEAGADPSYFERLGYVKMGSSYPWGSPRLYQRPGPGNPLGRVKFEFPNAYAVFLHDTPKKGLFQRSRRDFSHGCMRLERAVDFARILLRDDDNPLADKADAYLSNFQSKHVSLLHPVPIVVEYATASSNGGGDVVFCGDLYNWYQNLG